MSVVQINHNIQYIPVHQRGDRAPAPGATEAERSEVPAVRVTNLSEDTREGDLHDLFRPFGPVQRVYLAKDPVFIHQFSCISLTITGHSSSTRLCFHQLC